MSSKKRKSGFLKGVVDFRVASGCEAEAIEEFLGALDCPRSLMVWLLFREGEHNQLTKLEFNPNLYLTVGECRDAYAATKFLSKFTGLVVDHDLDEVAMQKFDEFELLCKQTNSRFKALESDQKFTGRVVWLHNATIRKISSILGEFEAEEFFSMPDWGPGASTLIKRRDASSVKKFQCETGITRDLYDLIPDTLMERVYPLWGARLREAGFPTFQTGCKVITVPKDASTNRVIAVEPGINLWFQSSVGRMIRRRLLRRGIDLRWQSRNQQLALKGSITNSLATVDLSSASDSISKEVVEALLPPRWYNLMDACRSHYGMQGSRIRRWEKFSSMGNGFTFELESLIFYAVALSCTEYLHLSTGDVSAYGDDVILPSAAYALFSECLEFYGFRVNGKKSHYDSPFRESCGAHFYSGTDIKPIYLKDRVSSVQSIFRLANAVRRLAHRRNIVYGCDARFRSVFEHLVQRVPKALRLRIPNDLGDGGFISCLDEATPSRARRGYEGYLVDNLVEVSQTYYDETVGYLLSSLWNLDDEVNPSIAQVSQMREGGIFHLLERRTKLQAIESWISLAEFEGRNSVPLKSRVRLRLTKSLVQQWYDLGPWL